MELIDISVEYGLNVGLYGGNTLRPGLPCTEQNRIGILDSQMVRRGHLMNHEKSSLPSGLLMAILMVACLIDGSTACAEGLDSHVPIDPYDMVRRMGTGVDATWSEVPRKIANYTPQATAEFARKGFRHVRLRVARDPAADTWAYLDGQIRDALDNGMIPIIANQSHVFENDPNLDTQAAWMQWWADMAEHYKDYPYELMFNLIVEIAARSPLSREPVDQLNDAYEKAVTAIRRTGGNNGERIIIISAPRRSDPAKMHLLRIPSQGNGYLIGEFHEGYAAGPSPDPTSPHYYWEGTDEEIALITKRVDTAMKWSDETGIPVWVGAWMPGNYNKGNDYDIERQIAFATDFIGVLNGRGIPHAVNATKKFYDVSSNTWTELEPVVDHIMSLALSPEVTPIQSRGWMCGVACEGIGGWGCELFLLPPLAFVSRRFVKVRRARRGGGSLGG